MNDFSGATVIVCTYRRGHVLPRILNELISQNIGKHYEILVVDQLANHAEPVSSQLAQWDRAGDIRYFNLPVAGLTHARNFGAERARSGILVYLDDDTRIGPNFVSEHIKMYSDQEIDAVAGGIVGANGKPEATPWIMGTNFSMRKSVYFEIGGSDEALGIHSYVEDIILNFKLAKAKKKVAVNTATYVIHETDSVGGCRITDKSQKTQEWEKPFSYLYLFHKEKKNLDFKWKKQLIWNALRSGPLRKQNVLAFWLQPYSWWHFFVSYKKAKSVSGSVT